MRTVSCLGDQFYCGIDDEFWHLIKLNQAVTRYGVSQKIVNVSNNRKAIIILHHPVKINEKVPPHSYFCHKVLVPSI